MSAVTRAPAQAPLAARLWRYQKERFPLAAYGPMVTVFTASAALYSRMARRAPGFIPWDRYAVGAFTALVFFAWLRILDEHKDADLDRRYRPELPVPRGLVTRAELRRVGVILLVAVVGLNAWLAPSMLGAMGAVALYAALMTREFFVPEWLRAHPVAYLLSHMVIMPLIDFYTTGLDWLAEGSAPPPALGLFLALTFLNGVVVEVGRKIRPPGGEREGVDTYSGLWGTRRAALVWIAVLALTAATAAWALVAVGGGAAELTILAVLALASAYAAVRFRAAPTAAGGKRIEVASGVWTIAMYLLLGVGLMVGRALGAG